MMCCDCHRQFLALGEWQIRCRSCYHAWKAGWEAPTFAAEVERLQAENATLRQELAQAREEVTPLAPDRAHDPPEAPRPDLTEQDADPGRAVAPDRVLLPSGPPRRHCFGRRSHPLAVGESALSKSDKRAVNAAHTLLMERFPKVFPQDYDAIRPLKKTLRAGVI